MHHESNTQAQAQAQAQPNTDIGSVRKGEFEAGNDMWKWLVGMLGPPPIVKVTATTEGDKVAPKNRNKQTNE